LNKLLEIFSFIKDVFPGKKEKEVIGLFLGVCVDFVFAMLILGKAVFFISFKPNGPFMCTVVFISYDQGVTVGVCPSAFRDKMAPGQSLQYSFLD